MWLLILRLAFAVPASAGAGDQLCEATGQGSGCLGTVTPSSPVEREPREPSCDAACRQQAQEAYDYAASHIEEPQDLAGPGADDIREKRTLASAEKDDAGRDAQLAGAALLVMAAPVEAPLWLVGLGVFGTAVILVEPHAHLERYVPAIWSSLVSLARAEERKSEAEQPAPAEPEKDTTSPRPKLKYPKSQLPVSGDKAYQAPKQQGNPEVVPNPEGRGYVDKNGNVWEWAQDPHGGPHWDVQHPDGSHTNVFPDGHVVGKDNF